MKEDKSQAYHYKSVAKEYDDAFLTDFEYYNWSTDLIVKSLKLKKDDILIDLAGGTGFFSSFIHEKVGLNNKVICIDTCKEMIEKAKNYDNILTMCESASLFSHKKKMKYDKIFIKEAVHHFENRTEIFTRIYNQLNINGIICILTRPQNPEFPFFKAAIEAFEQSQPDYNIFITELKNAGFKVKMHQKLYPLKIKKGHWFALIRKKFMSHLSQFNDEEIAEGLKELEESLFDSKTLFFNDVLISIVGEKA